MGCCSSRQRPLSRQASESSLVPNTLRSPDAHHPPPPAPRAPITAPAPVALRAPPLNVRFNQPIQHHVKPWTSSRPRTKRQIDRDRREFWDTRVSGREEIWSALRVATEMLENGDVSMTQEIVNAAGITVPTGDLTKGVYDQQGNVYIIPKFCISYPTNLLPEGQENSSSHHGHDDHHDDEPDPTEITLQVAASFDPSLDIQKQEPLAAEPEHILRARLSNQDGRDVRIHFNSKDSVRIISARIAEKENIDLASTKLTLVYLGKILQDEKTLVAQGWKEGHVVNVLVRPRI
ncbi:hypothetical protein EX30DRAFT_338686 [Ascodesmis nigricans]|uniref:Ubiquitin-like domain-containing protein n=1 Tax=Ascodesmis nigricans TaxID=341454 RepID=A0A4S2N4Q9_9PEZI|nr:hypothetical protein EX30DRAFT_338686 [Ascodesmis nigricans]